MVVRAIEAEYEAGVFHLADPLDLAPGERVRLIVMQQPDPKRWDMARIANAAGEEDLALAELGLSDWADELDAADRA